MGENVCPRCNGDHALDPQSIAAQCPMVKIAEYHPNGNVAKIIYYESKPSLTVVNGITAADLAIGNHTVQRVEGLVEDMQSFNVRLDKIEYSVAKLETTQIPVETQLQVCICGHYRLRHDESGCNGNECTCVKFVDNAR